MASKKDNNENKKNNGVNNQEGKNMKKNNTKLTVNMIDGQIMITAINGKKLDEQKRFGVYSVKENMLPHISIRPIKGSWLELDVHIVEDENGKMIVEAVREQDAYWAMAEVILGGKKAVNKAKKVMITKRQEILAAKEQQAAQATENNGILIGAETHGYVYSKPLPGINEETIDLGKFGTRTMRWGKGLDCTKVFDCNKEVARIMWDKDGSSPRIRFMGEEGIRYYMLSYDQKSFIHFEDKKKVVVMDGKLATALMFFYRNFVMKLAELKGWKLPEKKQPYYQDKGYWDALEKEHEADEAAIEAARQARKNSKGNNKKA